MYLSLRCSVGYDSEMAFCYRALMCFFDADTNMLFAAGKVRMWPEFLSNQ